MIGIVLNTDYHYATGLSLYSTLTRMGLDPAFYMRNNYDKFNFKGVCASVGLKILPYAEFDTAFVVTAREKDIVPNFHDKNLKHKKLIFVNHEPSTHNNITKKFFPSSLLISNWSYEQKYSNNFFYQIEYPFKMNSIKENTAGIICNFNYNNSYNLELIQQLTNTLALPVKLIGQESNNVMNDKCSVLTNPLFEDLFLSISKQKYLILPYINDDYVDSKMSETFHHSLAFEIPLICLSKYKESYPIDFIPIDDHTVKNIENFDMPLFVEQVRQFKEKAITHNSNIIEQYLKLK